jgi:hypothetical protein
MHDSQEGALASTGYLATSIPYFLTRISPANPHRFKEPTSGLEPPTCSLRVMIHALQCLPRVANAAYLSRFPFSAPVCPMLQRIAFVVVSKWCQELVDYASPVPMSSGVMVASC